MKNLNVTKRHARLSDDFGLKMAQKYFHQETIDSLGLYVKGKNKGKNKGIIAWTKIQKNGVCNGMAIVQLGFEEWEKGFHIIAEHQCFEKAFWKYTKAKAFHFGNDSYNYITQANNQFGMNQIDDDSYYDSIQCPKRVFPDKTNYYYIGVPFTISKDGKRIYNEDMIW